MARKFIINNGTLIMGQVELHRDLCKDHSTTKGGGWFHVDDENKKIFLYSCSTDYGFAERQDIEHALQTGWVSQRLKDFQFYHSESIKLEDALNNSVLLKKYKQNESNN